MPEYSRTNRASRRNSKLSQVLTLLLAAGFVACDTPTDPQLALVLSQPSVEFRAIRGTANPLTQTITVSNAGSGRLGPISCAESVDWLTCTVAGGNQVTLTANPSGLAQSPPQAIVALTAPGAAGTVNLAVDLRIDAPVLTLNASTVTFFSTEQTGTTTPATATVNVTNTGAGTLGNLGTIACTPTPANPRVTCTVNQATGGLTVAVNPAGLDPGSYLFPVTVSAPNSGVTQTFGVALTVGGRPRMTLSRQSLFFQLPRGTTQTQTQSIEVTNSGTGTLGTLACSSPVTWLTCTVSGSTVNVTANATGLTATPAAASVTVTASNAINSPQTVTVTLALAQQVLGLTADTASFLVIENTTTVSPASRVIRVLNLAADTTAALLGAITCSPPENTPVTCTVNNRQLTLTVNPANLTEGVKIYPIQVTAEHSDITRTIAVTVDVERPYLVVTPTSVAITNNASATVQVSNAAGARENLGTITCTLPNPANVTCTVNQTTGVITITGVPTGLAAGSYTRILEITAANAQNTQFVTVQLTVT